MATKKQAKNKKNNFALILLGFVVVIGIVFFKNSSLYNRNLVNTSTYQGYQFTSPLLIDSGNGKNFYFTLSALNNVDIQTLWNTEYPINTFYSLSANISLEYPDLYGMKPCYFDSNRPTNAQMEMVMDKYEEISTNFGYLRVGHINTDVYEEDQFPDNTYIVCQQDEKGNWNTNTKIGSITFNAENADILKQKSDLLKQIEFIYLDNISQYPGFTYTSPVLADKQTNKKFYFTLPISSDWRMINSQYQDSSGYNLFLTKLDNQKQEYSIRLTSSTDYKPKACESSGTEVINTQFGELILVRKADNQETKTISYDGCQKELSSESLEKATKIGELTLTIPKEYDEIILNELKKTISEIQVTYLQ